MKISCGSWSHHRCFAAGQLNQLEWVAECARLGLDGVELLAYHFPSTEREYLTTLKKTCTDHYLAIAMVSADGHLTVQDDAQRKSEVDAIRKWIDIAAFMGAPCVRFFCGSGEELAAGGPALHGKVRDAILEVAEAGAERGIVMALENHGGTTADQLLKLLADVGNPFLKFTLDTGNFPPVCRVGAGTYSSIERCAPHAAIVHAKFINVLPDGHDAEFDWSRIRAILAKAGFQGFLSIEYEGGNPDEKDCVERIAGFLKTLR